MADEQTKCFIDKCKDESADRVFSPANFLCHFKRSQFTQARPCLEESEPLTFLKCDQQCHSKAVTNAMAGSSQNRPNGADKRKNILKTVFSTPEMDNYENELDLLCSFQECYKTCHESIINQICATGLADMALDLVATYVQWHAADVYDWHLVTENVGRLPASCARLTNNNNQLQQHQLEAKHTGDKDPILKLMKNVS
uniref:Uncharacterized protein n=1 Tax=Ditylenchus dipsaci TaxID=166011 RepID=A0A915E290_9BILA